MASKQLYLWGDSPSTSRTIELPEKGDFDDLQDIVASHFAIVDARGTLPNQDCLPEPITH
jgi:hypothetical protein